MTQETDNEPTMVDLLQMQSQILQICAKLRGVTTSCNTQNEVLVEVITMLERIELRLAALEAGCYERK